VCPKITKKSEKVEFDGLENYQQQGLKKGGLKKDRKVNKIS